MNMYLFAVEEGTLILLIFGRVVIYDIVHLLVYHLCMCTIVSHCLRLPWQLAPIMGSVVTVSTRKPWGTVLCFFLYSQPFSIIRPC